MKKHSVFKSTLKLAAVLMFGAKASLAAEMCITAGSDDKKGTQNNYSYELWNQNSKGTACMTLGSGALFSGRWSGVDDYLARRGLSFDSTKTPDQLGYFNAVFTATYTPGCEMGGNSYMGIYGWTQSPLVEYYIVENWCNWNPSMDSTAKYLGWRLIDGNGYKVYSVLRKNAPNITGKNQDFTQYFSIRDNTHTNGTVNVSAHFAAWKEFGLTMGKLYEVSFLVEGYKSSGSFSFSKLEVNKTSTPYIAFDGFDILPTYNTLRVGQTLQLTKQFYPSNATDQRLEYSSYNSSIITVSSTGLVTAKKAGQANILAYSYDGMKRDEAVFTVSP